MEGSGIYGRRTFTLRTFIRSSLGNGEFWANAPPHFPSLSVAKYFQWFAVILPPMPRTRSQHPLDHYQSMDVGTHRET